ncbi:MAG: tRNA (adenosine(37)-N6)-dimethylallyltransferase MiaA [Gemmatimonadales bacterium]
MSSSGGSAGAELRIICGPTGAGKTALALELAERHGLTVISADSRQLYRGFDVGTAKPTRAERARVPHRGIDVADPSERWSAGRWAAEAGQWISEAGPSRVLVVGGTGLYLRALVSPLFDAPPLDEERRAELARAFATKSTSELRRWVAALDPARAHLGRAQLLRAAEVALLTGRRISDLHRDAARTPAFRARWLLVDPARALHARIAERLDAMLGGGWIDEVRTLEQRVPPDAPAWQACGYETVRALARGTLAVAPAREAILISTRQYAKRQRTWFRHQLGGERVVRVDPHDPRRAAVVEDWWSAGALE